MNYIAELKAVQEALSAAIDDGCEHYSSPSAGSKRQAIRDSLAILDRVI